MTSLNAITRFFNPINWRNFWLLVVGITLWRIAALYWAALPTMPDEAQYRFYAAVPALSYYSKPPLLPWLIAFSSYIFGASIASARLMMPLLHALNAYLIARSVRVVAPQAQAVMAGALYILMPAVSYSSGLATTDPVMMTGWCLALWGATRLWYKQRHAVGSSTLMGAGMALSVLGKYIGLMWWVSTWPLWRNNKRALIVAALLCAGLLLPHTVGLALNHFNTLQHTADNVNVQATIGHTSKLIEFWLGQIAVFGPLPLIVLIQALFTQKSAACAWFLRFAWPLLLLMSVQAWMSRAHANWAAAAYIGACAAVALYSTHPPKWWRVNQLIYGGLAVALPLLIALLNTLTPHLNAKFDPAAEARSFVPVNNFVQTLLTSQQAVGVMSHQRRTLSLLIEYAHLAPNQVATPPLSGTQKAKTHYQQYYALGANNTQRWLYITFARAGCTSEPAQPIAGRTVREVAQFMPNTHAHDTACFRSYVVE